MEVQRVYLSISRSKIEELRRSRSVIAEPERFLSGTSVGVFFKVSLLNIPFLNVRLSKVNIFIHYKPIS